MTTRRVGNKVITLEFLKFRSLEVGEVSSWDATLLPGPSSLVLGQEAWDALYLAPQVLKSYRLTQLQLQKGIATGWGVGGEGRAGAGEEALLGRKGSQQEAGRKKQVPSFSFKRQILSRFSWPSLGEQMAQEGAHS